MLEDFKYVVDIVNSSVYDKSVCFKSFDELENYCRSLCDLGIDFVVFESRFFPLWTNENFK